MADWCRRQWRAAVARAQAVLLDLEGHGREELLGRDGLSQVSGRDEVSGDIDLTRTVGWFTSLYPVRLDPGPLDLEEALAGGPALGRALKTIKEQLRAVPGKGLGYGLLRYLNAETAAALAGAACAAAWLQLSGAVCRPAAPTRTGRRPGARRGCGGLAAAIRRCRWRM